MDTMETTITRIARLFGPSPVIGAGWEKGARISVFTFAAAVIVLLVEGFSSTASNAGSAGLEDPDNWPQYHRTHDAWRFSPLTQINRDNVKRLKVAWIHQPGDITHGIQATPLAIDGVVYYISAFNVVHALDGATGKAIWQYKPKLDAAVTQLVFPAWSRGVAIAHGRVYLGTLDGRGIALDQKTGQEIWAVQLTRFKGCHGCNFTSPPVVAGDVLTFGGTGGELAQSGDIYGVDAQTGKLLWTFATIKDDPASWPGESGKHGGGSAWMSGTYDPATNTVYYGTGNAAPWGGEDREGDNLYTASVLALDPKSGALKWYRQEIPHDVWDYDSAYEVLQIPVAGKDYLVHMSKGGFVFVMEKNGGTLHNVWRYSNHINWVDSIDPKTGELQGRHEHKLGEEMIQCPSATGGRGWNSGAYSPVTGLWYNSGLEACASWTPIRLDPSKLGLSQGYNGIQNVKRVPPPGDRASARLDARDPITGETKWSVDYPFPGYGGVLATAGGLVFNGDSEGVVRAHDADSGKELWSFRTGSGIRGGIISYGVNGKQYVLVPSGWGSYASIFAQAWFPELKKVNGGAALIAFTVE
jgi:alcohol dehydrogenase (cytochrome c)